MPKSVHLSIGEFATPPFPRGHFRTGAFEALLNLGDIIHQRIQAENGKDPGYRAEVPLKGSLYSGDYRFVVTGRADGIFEGDSGTIIEEIKSTASVKSLLAELKEDPEHPYTLQLFTYCYFFEKQSARTPTAHLLIVSSRTGEKTTLVLPYDRLSFEAFLKRKLPALVLLEKEKEKRARRRKALSKKLHFPFDVPRKGQESLISFVTEQVEEGGRTLLQAPTGYGKTVAILYPVLKNALSRGTQVVYVTPKNSQFSVVVDAVKAMQARGHSVRALVLTAKSKVCLSEDTLNCDPGACDYSKNFFDKLRESDADKKLSRGKLFEAYQLKKMGEKFQTCPYGLSLEMLPRADLIVCDYNYVFSPSANLLGTLLNQKKGVRPNLIIDEIHNLSDRASDYYSPGLGTLLLDDVAARLFDYPPALLTKLEEFLNELRAFILSFRPESSHGPEVSLDSEILEAWHERMTALFVKVMQEETVDTRPVFDLFIAVDHFVRVHEEAHAHSVCVYESERGSEGLKIRCLDVSPYLEKVYPEFHSVTGFSATLKPFEFFRRISGFPEHTSVQEFVSPFPSENRKVLVIPQVSTIYRQRDQSAPKVAEIITRVSHLKPGHYVAYFPSYQFLEQVRSFIQSPSELFVQRPAMSYSEVKKILKRLQEPQPFLILAVQGGVLAEGVDFQSKDLRGVFIVGPALPVFNFHREKLREFYEERYGEGYSYAYTYPAMVRSIQAAGRVIRSEEKRGLLVFLDRRFAQEDYASLMPQGWFESSVDELVSRNILSDVERFWAEGP